MYQETGRFEHHSKLIYSFSPWFAWNTGSTIPCDPRYAGGSGGFQLSNTDGSVNSYTSTPRGRQEASIFFSSPLCSQPQAERSPPGHVLNAQRTSISAKNSKKSPGFAGDGSLRWISYWAGAQLLVEVSHEVFTIFV